MQTTTKTQRFGLQRYFLLWVTLSFLGWVFETLFVFVAFGKWNNQGFLRLPVCPIYGSSLMSMFWLAGTPDAPRGLLKNVENRLLRYGLYALLAFIVPSIAEFAVGFILDKGFDTWLWDYSGFAFNVMGYVCVPVSIVWMALIFPFMKFIFPRIRAAIGKIPTALSWGIAIAILAALGVDFLTSTINRLQGGII